MASPIKRPRPPFGRPSDSSSIVVNSISNHQEFNARSLALFSQS